MMAVSQNNVYIHSNPPKAISGQGAAIRNWVKNGDLEKLESVVLEGQGARLLGLMESTGDVKVKTFLKSIPGYMAKVDLIHDAVIRGSLRETQALIDKRKLSTARDAVGRGIAHKAVLYNHKSLLEWMAKKYPEAIHLKDNEGRTCLHYTAANKEAEELYNVLVKLGANTESIDIHGRKPGYYINRPEELDIEGPYNRTQLNNSSTRSFSRGANRLSRRISPISPKSTGSLPSSLNITRSQIRIWIHEKDIAKLERIVWSGNGNKLITETTNNAKVRKFLDNVPHLLSHIKSIHTAAIHNDVNTLKSLRQRTADIEEVFTSKDSHGLTPFHKAVGLGNRATVEYLLYECPSMLNEPDNEGHTPLHYASKDPSMFSFLSRAGGDENAVDSRGKTPGYYKTHSNDLDTKHLRNIPDAPRVTGDIMGWERGISPLISGAAAATALANNKRKISTGEFSGGSSNGQVDAEDEILHQDIPASPVKNKSSLNLRNNSRNDGGKSNSSSNNNKYSGTKFRKTDESGDEIEDVNDGYVADSDEGKYDLNTDFEIQPMEEEEDDELDKELQAIGNEESSNNQTPNDLFRVEERELTPAAPKGIIAKAKSTAMNVIAQVEQKISKVTKHLETTPDEPPYKEEEGISDIQQPKMDDDVPEQNYQVAPEQREPIVPELSNVKNIIEEVGLGATSVKGHKTEGNKSGGHKSGEHKSGEHKSGGHKSERHQVKTPGWEAEYPTLIQDEVDEEPKQQSSKDLDFDGAINEMDISSDALVGDAEHDVHAYLENGDMEKLVEMVLDGKGSELIGKESSQVEVQEFLVNVPAYMAKIASIHSAAGSGNLRDLQSLLDRKRLAQARDEVGRVPLHHAVLNGHSNVTRYLASNYQQSLSMLDINKRSPLHYAATLPDQGALYKVLIQAGADPNLKDIEGNTAGIYLRRKDLLTQSDLLHMTPANTQGKLKQEDNSVDTWERPLSPPPLLHNEVLQDTAMEALETPQDIKENDVENKGETFAMDEEAEELLQETTTATQFGEEDSQIPKELQQFPAIWSEEGKYLASVLGDALVKGLTQVSHERPNDPVEYLANFLKQYGGAKESAVDAAIAAAAAAAKAANEMGNIERVKTPRPDTPVPNKLGSSHMTSSSRSRAESMSKASPNKSAKQGQEQILDGETKLDESLAKLEQQVSKQIHTSESVEEVVTEEGLTEHEIMNELEKEEVNMMQRLEDAADDEAVREALAYDEEEDENRIHQMEEIDDEIDGGDGERDSVQNGTRDDRGQSVLHFAAARPGGASTILAFLQNPSVNLAWKDERLRTARDIAKGMSRTDNLKTIDSWIVSLTVAGDKESLESLLLDGYDHLTNIEDSNGTHVIDLAEKAGKRDLALFLRSIPDFNERLLKLHRSIRIGDMENVKNLMMRDHRLATAISPWGKTALHVAVLVEEYNIVRFICEHFPESLKRGDNLERTPLHYAMGIEKVEKMTRILVRNGAKRVVKDLRGRQPSYYFINREEIGILQREEEELKAGNDN